MFKIQKDLSIFIEILHEQVMVFKSEGAIPKPDGAFVFDDKALETKLQTDKSVKCRSKWKEFFSFSSNFAVRGGGGGGDRHITGNW